MIGNRRFVFIDEAQRVSDIGIALKLIHDNLPDVHVIATGSSSFDLANKISEPLTGRKIEFILYPFSFSELTNHSSLIEEKRLIEKRIVYGYYPDVVNNPGSETEILKEITSGYLYKDLFEFEKIRKPSILEKLLQTLAFQAGNVVNYNEISRFLGIDHQTVEKYIDLLEKSFVIYRLGSFSRYLRNEMKKSRKIFFIDNGVRNAIIRSFNPVELRNDTGNLWENYIVTELKKKNEYNRRWVNSWFWRTTEKNEIDYLEESDNKLNAYEIKWSQQARFRYPAAFCKAYPESNRIIIIRDNFWDYLI
jgi:predicted AAA+ superfamily ATPase